MAVTFIAGYTPARTSTLAEDHNVAYDEADDGTPLSRDLGSTTYTTVEVVLRYLTEARKDTLIAWCRNHRSSEIDLEIDGETLRGRFRSAPRLSMVGALHTVRFTFKGYPV